jgi:hypothetical protein
LLSRTLTGTHPRYGGCVNAKPWAKNPPALRHVWYVTEVAAPSEKAITACPRWLAPIVTVTVVPGLTTMPNL